MVSSLLHLLLGLSWSCVSLQLLSEPLLELMASSQLLFEEEGVATMAIEALAQLPDLSRAFRLLRSAKGLRPLSYSGLLAACEKGLSGGGVSRGGQKVAWI